jgi:hypothetical protein
MSPADVYGNEMDEPRDFDDETTEALLAGAGRDADARIAELIGDMRASYVSDPPAVGAALAALIETTDPVVAFTPRRLERMRSSVFAKIGAATAAAFAATGGLAVAGALPAPVQDAVSHIGVGEPAHHGKHHTAHTTAADDESTTTTTAVPGSTPPSDETSTTVEPRNHGEEVSGVAHDDSNEGCEHGHAVAAVASGGKSQGNPCPTTSTTVGDGTTPTTVEDGHGHGHDDGNESDDDNDDVDHGDSGEHGPPTSVPGHGDSGDHGHQGSGSD